MVCYIHDQVKHLFNLNYFTIISRTRSHFWTCLNEKPYNLTQRSATVGPRAAPCPRVHIFIRHTNLKYKMTKVNWIFYTRKSLTKILRERQTRKLRIIILLCATVLCKIIYCLVIKFIFSKKSIKFLFLSNPWNLFKFGMRHEGPTRLPTTDLTHSIKSSETRKFWDDIWKKALVFTLFFSLNVIPFYFVTHILSWPNNRKLITYHK